MSKKAAKEPTTLQCVRAPRDVAAKYWYEPWSAVVAAAEQGVDGLSVVVTAMPDRNDTDVAFLRKSDPSFGPDKTVLLQQNW